MQLKFAVLAIVTPLNTYLLCGTSVSEILTEDSCGWQFPQHCLSVDCSFLTNAPVSARQHVSTTCCCRLPPHSFSGPTTHFASDHGVRASGRIYEHTWPSALYNTSWGRGGLVVRLTRLPPRRTGFDSGRSHIPDFRHVGIVPDNATGRRIFSEISCFPRLCITTPLHTHLTSPRSALKTSMEKTKSGAVGLMKRDRTLEKNEGGLGTKKEIKVVGIKELSEVVYGSLPATRQAGNTIGCMRSVNVRHLSWKYCGDACLIAGNEPWTTSETSLKDPAGRRRVKHGTVGVGHGRDTQPHPLSPPLQHYITRGYPDKHAHRSQRADPVRRLSSIPGINSEGVKRFWRLLTARSSEPMGAIEMSMEQRRNEGRGKREVPEETRRSTASSGTIPTCENPHLSTPPLAKSTPNPTSTTQPTRSSYGREASRRGMKRGTLILRNEAHLHLNKVEEPKPRRPAVRQDEGVAEGKGVCARLCHGELIRLTRLDNGRFCSARAGAGRQPLKSPHRRQVQGSNTSCAATNTSSSFYTAPYFSLGKPTSHGAVGWCATDLWCGRLWVRVPGKAWCEVEPLEHLHRFLRAWQYRVAPTRVLQIAWTLCSRMSTKWLRAPCSKPSHFRQRSSERCAECREGIAPFCCAPPSWIQPAIIRKKLSSTTVVDHRRPLRGRSTRKKRPSNITMIVMIEFSHPHSFVLVMGRGRECGGERRSGVSVVAGSDEFIRAVADVILRSLRAVDTFCMLVLIAGECLQRRRSTRQGGNYAGDCVFSCVRPRARESESVNISRGVSCVTYLFVNSRRRRRRAGRRISRGTIFNYSLAWSPVARGCSVLPLELLATGPHPAHVLSSSAPRLPLCVDSPRSRSTGRGFSSGWLRAVVSNRCCRLMHGCMLAAWIAELILHAFALSPVHVAYLFLDRELRWLSG
ncbi:hypothetical protein PR048_019884 [Dryococelus australis]|uniref:Uncharacterized protein n=1 Tax=Dryococelus australis TaxID=614101 RepID=A0ABQ9H4R8_9NEOP|nr:hypothetical protein PR048_019884 [Dryococelus australis]